MTVPPKKVAIIGAGPSGLVTAKTLLHNFPRGTFAPVIFDRREDVGGLWPNCPGPTGTITKKTWAANGANDPGTVTLDPGMRTNLSRFTVAFSDLSWESVLENGDIPMFPQARQVGQYLAAYAERYIPKEAFKLGSNVKKTERSVESGSSVKWRVFWDQNGAQNTHGEQSQPSKGENFDEFDYLVVASGYFARPNIPKMPGLEQFTGRVIHSSTLSKAHEAIIDEDLRRGNVAILGGSMSGVEAASTFAMHHSSSRWANTEEQTTTNGSIYHISSRPFWTLPTYLPHNRSSSSDVQFVPLDLTMYDLDRRPAGPIEYYLGPIPKEKVAKTNAYFHSLLGDEYEKFGHVGSNGEDSSPRPPWVAIGNDYAGFVRSGTIEPTIGRATSIQSNSDPNKNTATVKIETKDGESRSLENVSCIVMATGFTPFESLSFLPPDVLSALEYTPTDSFLPLVLDQGGSLRSDIPDLGFVGFYRGPYWGVMEMQARFLGKTWASAKYEPSQTESQRENIRLLRQPATQAWRGQFPMGDYVGLMETLAKDLGIERTELEGLEGSGPVIPARYIYNDSNSSSSKDQIETGKREPSDAQSSLNSLSLLGLNGSNQSESPEIQAAIAMAIFRALHGKWKFTKRGYVGEIAGTVAFHPRFPTDPAYDREYVCEELSSESTDGIHSPIRSIWRLSEAGEAGFPIRISPVIGAELGLEGQVPRGLSVLSTQHQQRPGDRTASDSSVDANFDSSPDYVLQDGPCKYEYWFDGVSISRWELSRIDENCDQDGTITRIVYTRS